MHMHGLHLVVFCCGKQVICFMFFIFVSTEQYGWHKSSETTLKNMDKYTMQIHNV